MSATGGDPTALRLLARGGTGQAFTLDRTAGELTARARWPVTPRLRREAQRTAWRVRAFGQRVWTLDRWVAHVATLLEVADSSARRLAVRLVALGPSHPAAGLAARAVSAAVGHAPGRPSPSSGAGSGDGSDGSDGSEPLTVTDWLAVRWQEADDDSLAEVLRWSQVPTLARDRVARVLADRHLAQLRQRIRRQRVEVRRLRSDRGALDRMVVWVDRVVLGRVDPLTVLHVSAEDALGALEREASGLRWVLRQDALLLDFPPGAEGPTRQPTLRLAMRDPADATSVAVLVPGTASGVANPAPPFADLTALQHALDTASPDGANAVVVLDLYDAPDDLGRAADPGYGEVAGAALATFVTRTWPDDRPLVTLVGHSYGAFTAARTAAAGADVDRIIALGAPGLGALHAAELGLPPGAVVAALAPGDPVALVADLDELVAGLPAQHRDRLGPLTDPLAALGPDPTDPEFGARRLSTEPSSDTPGDAIRGHLDYLTPGSASLAAVAEVVLEPRR